MSYILIYILSIIRYINSYFGVSVVKHELEIGKQTELNVNYFIVSYLGVSLVFIFDLTFCLMLINIYFGVSVVKHELEIGKQTQLNVN